MKVLILGYGSIGRRHARLLETVYPKADITCVTRSRPSKCKYDWISRSDFDNSTKLYEFGIISTPISCHLEDIQCIIDKCTKILVEKPLIDLRDKRNQYRDIEKLKECSNIYVGYNMKFYPIIKKIKATMQELTNEGINYIYSAKCYSHIREWRGTYEASRVSLDPKLNGNVINELSHDIDIFLWSIDYQAPKKFSADIIRPSLLPKINTDWEVGHSDRASIQFSDNSYSGTISLSMSSHVNEREVILETPKKMMRFDLITGEESHYAHGKVCFKLKHNHDRDQTFVDQIKCIVEGTSVPELTSLDDALKLIKLIKRCRS